MIVESPGLKFSIPGFLTLVRKLFEKYLCVCVSLDLSRFVGVEKHLEISGYAYVSLLHSSANKALGNYWSWVKFCSRDFFLHFFGSLRFFFKGLICVRI